MGRVGLRGHSFLFVPGSDAQKVERALRSDADAVILDLEDAVAPSSKQSARRTVARALKGVRRPGRMIRINAADTDWFEADLAFALHAGVDALVVPKANIDALAKLRTSPVPVIALVETARGLLDVAAVAAAPPTQRLMLGAVDLGRELGLHPLPHGLELLAARHQLVVASAAEQLAAPIDSVCVDLRDSNACIREAFLARSLGFGAKACIHPKQLDAVHRAFRPRATEVAWARRVVAAYQETEEDGAGAVVVGGEMVDRPVFERARDLLARLSGDARAAAEIARSDPAPRPF